MAKPVIFAVGEEFLRRDGLGKQVAEWEDGLRAPTDPGTFEWWYFDAHLADGSTAVIVYATKPIINPNVPLMPNLSLTITRPDGTKTAQFDLPPAGEFSASKERCEVRIGASWVRQSMLEGRWVYELHAETKDMSADLTFSGLVPPWRPGAGKCFFGDLDHYFAWLPAIPHGTVSGTLTLCWADACRGGDRLPRSQLGQRGTASGDGPLVLGQGARGWVHADLR